MRRLPLALALPVLCLLSLLSASAQTPVALPYTMTTLAGGLVPTTFSPPTTNCPGSTTVKATTAYGDNCAAVSGTFGAAGRGGVVVDPFGYVFVADDINSVVHMIDPTSGVMTVAAGKGAACTGKTDSAGDGCLAATQTTFSSSLRGIGSDPYGNILLAGYNDNEIHVICRTASPLCTAAQVGTMQLVAGCVSTKGSAATGGSTTTIGTDNLLGVVVGASCASGNGIVDGARGATADLYGNVYFADTNTSRFRVVVGPRTSSSFSGTNPLIAALGVYFASVTPGYAYSVVNTQNTPATCYGAYSTACGGSAAAPASGTSCSVTTNGTTYSGRSTDAYGDGCPLEFSSTYSSSGATNGVAVDAAGNLLFTDPTRGLRVFFVQGWPSASAAAAAGATGSVATAGVAMYQAIYTNNGSTAPQPGFNYMLAGGGSTAISATPTLGNSTAALDSSITKLTVSPQGNIYIGDSGQVLFFDINTGTIRILLKSGISPSVGTYCSGTSGAKAKSAYGDGCPASVVQGATSHATFANSGGLGVAVDGQGNLYLYDASPGGANPMLVRKVLAQGVGSDSAASLAARGTVANALPLQSLGTAQTQTYLVHFPYASGSSVTATNSTNSNFAYGAPACTSNADNSLDCTVTVTYTPTAAGPQSASMTLAAPGGETATLNLGGTVAGSVLAIDSPSVGGTSLMATASLFSGSNPYSVAVDGAGNVYTSVSTSSTYSILESVAGSASSAVSLKAGLSAKPTSLAVDRTGNIYYLNGSSAIQELAVNLSGATNTYTPTTLSYVPVNLGTPNPVALAVDSFGNLLVADNQGGTDTVYKLSTTAFNSSGSAECNYPETASPAILPTLCQSVVYGDVSSAYAPLTFGVVNALAVDPSGNIYVSDTTYNKIYELTAGVDASLHLYDYTESTPLSGVSATGLSTDAAGDLYVQTSSGVTMYPQTGVTSGVTVFSGESSPDGIAVDGLGNLYNADSGLAYLTQVARGAVLGNFGSSTTTTLSATLTNTGNQSSATPTSGSNPADFILVGGSSSPCSFNSSYNNLSATAAGASCEMSATFSAEGDNPISGSIAFTPAPPSTSTGGALALSGQEDIESWAATTIIETTTTTTPTFASSGTEISYPITVATNKTGTSGDPQSYGASTSQHVNVQIDSTSAAATQYTLTSANNACTDAGYTSGYFCASVTVPLAGLTAGSHTLYVTFPAQGVFNASATASQSFTIAQVGTTLSWMPSAATQQVSAAIGASVLNATVTPSVAGNFAYALNAAPSCTATSAAGATPIDASTYLPIGTYTLYATFCPTDTTDYAGSSTSGLTYTVTQATTTAAVGASTMVVAPSGGNYTTLSAALAALPVTGGTIYIAPGTYPTGGSVISYPNVQLRGLGGDPTQVILTGENGDFSASGYPSGFNGLGVAGKGSDEGSATLDVSKNAFIGTQATAGNVTYTPNNFYAEYLTLQNTFDTDATTTTTWTATSNGGTCSTGSTAHTLQYLYNNNLLCGAQAMALFLNSDGAVLNNVNLLGQQDTLYASGLGCGTYCTVAREYMWKGLISGDVDYTFGDAALVFDHTNFFTTWHGLTATGQETITAQNKRFATGTTASTNSSAPTSTDYLSGFICNACTLMSQSTGMTKLYYGRPYDISTSSYPSSYSTWIMLNSAVDQVNSAGWIGWDGASQYLSTSTYGEFNTMSYTDPTPGTGIYPYSIFNSTPSLLYSTNSGNSTAGSLLPTGGNTGSGTALGSREGSAIALNAGTAAQYYPVAFLSTTVPSTKLSTGQSSNWNPVAALAAQVNSFVPVSSLGGVTLGSSVTILGRPQAPGAGIIPTGSYQFLDGTTVLASGNLDASGEAYLTTSSLGSGTHNITMTYGGDSNFTASTSSVYSILVLQSGQAATATALNVANTSSTIGSTISGTVSVTPAAAAGTVSVYLDGSVATSCVLTSGSCTWSISGPATGSHSMFASFPSSATYGQSASSNVRLYVSKPVATGDTRTVTEPSFPAVCQSLAATLVTDVTIQDLDASVDATTSNIDGARIQAALNACSAQAVAANSSLAVELSMDSTGTDNAFLSGPLSMPSNVTLLVDPNVTLYFSRNVQDYDKLSGTHTCGTVNGASATSSCLPLIDIPATSTNVGIMGFGKLNGRGGDPLMNGFATATYAAPSSYTWWNLSAQANGEGNQQNPRFIQMEAGSSNITLYKITILNSPMFHVSTQGAVNNFTAWDVKIVTPTAARNTDGIDPANVINGTVTQSWISDGDDNIAVSAPGTTAPAKNISITNNHFFAGHGESIGSYTGAGVSNILYDHNMSTGNAWGSTTSQWGSAVSASGSFTNGVADGNSTAIRIKTANDRGGLVTGIQYSNSCFLDHYTDIQFTPYYSSGDSTSELPSYTNILLQNLVFTTDNTKSGSVELTGEFNTNNGTPVTNPLYLTMDNVTFSSILSTLVNSSSPVETWSGGNSSGGTGQYTNLTVGPGQVSSNFLSAYNSLVATSSNNDTLTNNASLSSLDPPVCTFTYLAPELTGPTGLPQTIQYGNTATLDVILTPAVGGAAFPNGTVTLTDALTNNTFTGTFSGKGDTLAAVIPASDLAIGTHTFSVTAYSGDTNYTVPPSYQAFGSYNVTVVQAAQSITFAPSVTSYVYAPGLTISLSATATSGLTVSFASTSTGVCTVSGTTATILSTGTCTIQASQAGNSNYLAAPVAAVNYSIAQVPQRIASISPASGSTYTYTPGMTITLSATATSGLSVSFASTTTGVCTVSGTTATILSAGTCTIQASQAGNTEYSAGSSVSASYAIVNPLPAVSSISPASTSSGAAAFTLTVSGSGFVPGSTIYWGSNPLTTTYVNGTTLTGPVSATDITIPGIMPVTVQTTTPGGGTSNAMQFEIDSITVGTSSVPTIATTTATVVAGSTATYPVTVPTTVTITSVSCLNLPAGATCNYSASTGLTNIVTSSTTPAGTYNITVVFAETVTTTTAAAGLLPILLLPLFFLRRKLAVKSISFCLGVILLAGAALTIGCGGSSKSTAQSTTQSTSSAVVKLVVQ